MASLEPKTVADFLDLCNAAETNNRASALQDLQFRYGDQWPTAITNARKLEARPEFTINEVDGYVRQVVNGIRQQRPRGRADPTSSGADKEVAKIVTGLGRHIEVASDADNAYDTAVDFAATMGWGYWRVRTDYESDTSFDQTIKVDVIDNPFSVYFDPMSTLPDGSDAMQVLVTEMVSKDRFKALYPDHVSGLSQRGTGDSPAIWMTKDAVRLGEYFWIETEKATLCQISDQTTAWKEDLPPADQMAAHGLSVTAERQSWKRVVKWAKVTSFAVLEEATLPGRFIPIVPVYGVNVLIDGKRVRMGMVRFARDPQRLVNYWQTAIAESVAMAPKAKFLLQATQDEGYTEEWQAANISSRPVLHYNGVTEDGREMPPPIRLQPEPPPAGAIETAMLASQNLQRVLGMFDPVNLKHTGPKSGEAIRQEQGQSEQGNFHFYDNLVRSIKHTWRIFLDYMPVVYDTQRTLRIIGEDGKSDMVTVNEAREGIAALKNPLNVGTYDVVMETGPGYNTKRQESVGTLMALLQSPLGARIAAVADDVILRNMDFHGAQTIADRMAAANPLAKIDSQSDVPAQAQMQIQQLQHQLQMAMQQLQQFSDKATQERQNIALRENAETAREHMRLTAKAHDIDSRTQATYHDVQTKALTAQNVEEIKGLVQLLMHHLGIQKEVLASQVNDYSLGSPQ